MLVDMNKKLAVKASKQKKSSPIAFIIISRGCRPQGDLTEIHFCVLKCGGEYTLIRVSFQQSLCLLSIAIKASRTNPI